MVLNPVFSAEQRAVLVSAVVEAAPKFAEGATQTDKAAIVDVLKGVAVARALASVV